MGVKRILHITGMLNNGGTEAVVMNYYRNIDRSLIQFDFVTYNPEREYFNDEIESLGGQIHYIQSKKNPVKCFRGLYRLAKRYDTVHFHTASALCWFELLALRLGGVKNIIGHSHNTANLSEGRNRLQAFCRPLFSALCDYRFACSVAAGEWLFGKRAFEKSGRVVCNAIALEKFAYNEAVREKLRKEYEIGGALLLGHVGRFCAQKNQRFLLEVLDCLVHDGVDAKLMLVGWGEDEDRIKSLTEEKGLAGRVLFMGARGDVGELMQAMDVFLLPSVYEGLGIVLIEAQAAGLTCVYSDVVPPEARASGLAYAMSLTAGARVWADAVKDINIKNRCSPLEEIARAGYDIKAEAKKLAEFYMGI